jgi:hypothetical protein
MNFIYNSVNYNLNYMKVNYEVSTEIAWIF